MTRKTELHTSHMKGSMKGGTYYRVQTMYPMSILQ